VAKQILCGFGVDIDAVAGWLGSYGGEDSPSDIQRGMFAGEVGVPRLLKLFDKFKLKASWFIPGHSIETFPEQMAMIVAAGHEIGAHGYSHENPVAMTRRQEEDVLMKSVELIEKFSGRKPRGYVAPWWEMSAVTAELLRTCDQVVLNVRSDNPPALNAYRRLGYQEHVRFEERLATRLAEAAMAMRVPAAAGAEGRVVPFRTPAYDTDPLVPAEAEDSSPRELTRPLLIGGALTSAALSIAGAALVAWRRGRPSRSGGPMVRAARAARSARISGATPRALSGPRRTSRSPRTRRLD